MLFLRVLLLIYHCYGSLNIFRDNVALSDVFMVLSFRSPLLQTTSNVLIVSLSLSDFIMVLKTPMAAVNNFVQYPVMGHTGKV